MFNVTKKNVMFDDDARRRLIVGVDKLANAVKVTLGPGGRNVIIQRKDDQPIITKDGVTVAQHIALVDPHEDVGAKAVAQAASRTNDLAGDGTTTATVLTQALIHAGQKVLAAKYVPKQVVLGVKKAADDVVEHLRSQATPIETSEQISFVGTISANGDKHIGDAIAKAMERVGANGIIDVDEAKGFETQLELIDGIRIERGYTSPYFVTDMNRMVVEFDDPYILVTNRRYKSLTELIPILERVQRESAPILIIADEVEGEALKLLTANKMQGKLDCCVICAPERGTRRVTLLDDIACMVGATLITDGDGRDMSDVTLNDLGRCKKLTISKTTTTMIGGMSDRNVRDERIKTLESQLASDILTDPERDFIQRRLAILGGAAAMIKVGGATELEMIERRDRIVDALNATQAAADEGIIPGGGVALYRTAKTLMSNIENIESPDQRAGYMMMLEACTAPLRQILHNAGQNAEKIMAKLDDDDTYTYGYDAVRCAFVDMMKAGVIDPVKVTTTAVHNASSIGGIILTVGASIVDAIDTNTTT